MNFYLPTLKKKNSMQEVCKKYAYSMHSMHQACTYLHTQNFTTLSMHVQFAYLTQVCKLSMQKIRMSAYQIKYA